MEGGQVLQTASLSSPVPSSGVTLTTAYTALPPGIVFAQTHTRPTVPVKDDSPTHSPPAASIEDAAQTHEGPAAPVEDAAQRRKKPAAPVEDDTSYERWDPDAQEFLLEWLEMPGNYALYKGSGKRKNVVSNGSTKVSEKTKAWKNSNDTSWKTKAQVLHYISEFLRSKGVIKTPPQIGNKVKYFISSYRKAADLICRTGQGATDDLPQKVLNMCPLFKRLDGFMSARVPSIPPSPRVSYIPPNPRLSSIPLSPRVSSIPPNLGVSMDTVTADVVGTGTSATGSTAWEGLKGLTEAVLSLGEQHRRYGEQKLTLQAEWQSKQFEVLHRKLDLQQQEISLRLKELDSRNLKMELQIERLRAKRRRGGSSGSTKEDCDSD